MILLKNEELEKTLFFYKMLMFQNATRPLKNLKSFFRKRFFRKRFFQ